MTLEPPIKTHTDADAKGSRQSKLVLCFSSPSYQDAEQEHGGFVKFGEESENKRPMYQIKTVVHGRVNQLGMFQICQRGLRFWKASGKQFPNRSDVSTSKNIAPPTPFEPFCMITGKRTSTSKCRLSCMRGKEELVVKLSACPDRFDILNVFHIVEGCTWISLHLSMHKNHQSDLDSCFNGRVQS